MLCFLKGWRSDYHSKESSQRERYSAGHTPTKGHSLLHSNGENLTVLKKFGVLLMCRDKSCPLVLFCLLNGNNKRKRKEQLRTWDTMEPVLLGNVHQQISKDLY